MFDNIETNGVEAQVDRLGGGNYTKPSGIYKNALIQMAYVTDASSSKAKCLNLELLIPDAEDPNAEPFEHTERIWFFNRTGQATYERNGKKFYLPGFELANDMCLMATGIDFVSQPYEDKTVEVWDGAEGKKVQKSLPVFTKVIGKKVTVALQRVVENKQKKDEAADKYVDINEKRTSNCVVKFFHNDSGRTLVEVLSEKNGKPPLPEEKRYLAQWAEKNTGKDRDDYKEVAGASAGGGTSGTGTPGGTGAATSLFA